MLNHPNFTDAVKGLSDGRYTTEEAFDNLDEVRTMSEIQFDADQEIEYDGDHVKA